MNQSNLSQRQIAINASNKIEAKLFYAYKKLEELELKFEGVIACKLEPEQIADSIVSQKKEVDVLCFIDELIQDKLNVMNTKSATII